LHILVAVALIGVVLLQSGKGADIGAAFGGGSSQTVFGGRGATTLLHKVTTIAAILFMLTSLSLTLYHGERRASSVIREEPAGATGAPAPAAPPVPAPAPAAPGAAAPAK
ncbi:MAG TPA: preprotein translocase subunit SecG, partial [Candidatus Methylomirabilis sp.]|nr:preprotein translocase subunit SecG [Candidatus Methylomirabilis sp.]